MKTNALKSVATIAYVVVVALAVYAQSQFAINLASALTVLLFVVYLFSVVVVSISYMNIDKMFSIEKQRVEEAQQRVNQLNSKRYRMYRLISSLLDTFVFVLFAGAGWYWLAVLALASIVLNAIGVILIKNLSVRYIELYKAHN